MLTKKRKEELRAICRERVREMQALGIMGIKCKGKKPSGRQEEIEMLNKEGNLFRIKTNRADLETLAVSLFNEKVDFILSNLIKKSKAYELKSINSGSFYRICAGAGLNKKQGRRVLIFLIKTGKIKNRGKAGLEIVLIDNYWSKCEKSTIREIEKSTYWRER